MGNGEPCFSDAELQVILSGPPHKWPFKNDFLPVLEAGSAGAAYRDILSRLKELGAGFAGLSGAGSTCFGVFASPAQAGAAGKELLKRRYCTFETFSLACKAIQ